MASFSSKLEFDSGPMSANLQYVIITDEFFWTMKVPCYCVRSLRKFSNARSNAISVLEILPSLFLKFFPGVNSIFYFSNDPWIDNTPRPQIWFFLDFGMRVFKLC